MAILYPTSLANLVVEVGTRHCHQTLFLCHAFPIYKKSFGETNSNNGYILYKIIYHLAPRQNHTDGHQSSPDRHTKGRHHIEPRYCTQECYSVFMLYSSWAFLTFTGCALFWCWVSFCVPVTNSLIEFYFIMIIVIIIGIFMAIIFILNNTFRLSESK